MMMKESKKQQVFEIGADFGASSIKISYMQDSIVEDFLFPNRINVKVDVASGTLVETSDGSVRVGSAGGFSNSTAKKINYRYFKEILLTVAHTLKHKLNLDTNEITLLVKTCLPPTQFLESKEQYKQKVKDLSGSTGVVAGEEIKVNIADVTCGAEGVMLLRSFNINKLAAKLKNVLLIDIGSSTSDIIALEYDEETGKWKILKAITSEFAGEQMAKDITVALNGDGTGLSYKWEVLERTGEYQLDGAMHPITEQADAIDSTVKGLFSDIEKITSLRANKVILAGQGSSILAENSLFKEQCKNFAVVDDVNKIFGNSRGCLKS